MVATGPVMSDLVYGWSRKIKNNPGVLHLLPIPDDPFCHPSLTLYTDPLRYCEIISIVIILILMYLFI